LQERWQQKPWKQKLATLTDDNINKIIDAISEIKLEKITSLALLQAVKAKYPELVSEFEDLIT
jgi:digeranylgeranylglycerophospholipid reductase